MKNAMSSMLAQVQKGEEVTTEHIEIFKRKLKEDMEARKKRRIEYRGWKVRTVTDVP